MTRETDLAFDTRSHLVRHVAGDAGPVLRDSMQAVELVGRVTGRARWWRGHAVRAVRSVAARAGNVLRLRFVGVAGRAARRHVRRLVRVVARRALLVSRRGRARLVAMTARARSPRCLRSVRRARVTGLAIGVTRAGRRVDAIGVTPRAGDGDRLAAVRGMAERAIGVARTTRGARAIRVAVSACRGGARRLAGVRDMAVETTRGRVRLRLVAGLARNCLRVRRQ